MQRQADVIRAAAMGLGVKATAAKLKIGAEPRMPGGRCGWFLAIAYAEPAGPAAPRTHDAPEGLC